MRANTVKVGRVYAAKLENNDKIQAAKVTKLVKNGRVTNAKIDLLNPDGTIKMRTQTPVKNLQEPMNAYLKRTAAELKAKQARADRLARERAERLAIIEPIRNSLPDDIEKKVESAAKSGRPIYLKLNEFVDIVKFIRRHP